MSSDQKSSSPLPSVKFVLEASLVIASDAERCRAFSASASCTTAPQVNQTCADAATRDAKQHRQRTTSLDSYPGRDVDWKVWGRRLGDVPSDMLSVFRADGFGYRTHVSYDEDSEGVRGMDVDTQAVSDPVFPFLSTGPQEMFVHEFLLPPSDPLGDKDLVKLDDTSADNMELDGHAEDASMSVDDPVATSKTEDAASSTADDSFIGQDGYDYPQSSLRSGTRKLANSPAHHSTPVHSRQASGHERSFEETGRIHLAQPPSMLYRPTPTRPWHRNLLSEVSTSPAGPQPYCRFPNSVPIAHSLVPIRPPHSDVYCQNILPSCSMHRLPAAPSFSDCRTTPVLLSPSSSLSDLSSVSSMLTSMSESPYTRSRGERDGFDIVSLPADATLQTELPMNMKPIIPNIYSDSSYYDTTQAGLSSSAPPLEAHPSHPIHCHTSLHPAHNFPPCPPRQEDSQSFAHRCHLCARQFALPNGLAIHLKWHKEGPANQETKELESTSQSVVDASTRESPVPPVQLHAVRYDPGDNHAEYDIDPLMVMPPYLPKWRSAELAPSASPLREGLAVDQFPEPLENRNGLGLFLPPAALSSPHAPTVHSFDVPLAPLCIPDTRSSFGPQGPEYRHLPLDQSPDNAVSWQRYRDSPGPPGADDSKVSIDRVPESPLNVDPFSSYGERRHCLDAGSTTQPHVSDARDASPRTMPSQAALFAPQRSCVVTPPRARLQMFSDDLSPLKELVELRPLPFSRNDVYRS